MPRLGEDVGDTYAVEHLIRGTLGALSVPTSMYPSTISFKLSFSICSYYFSGKCGDDAHLSAKRSRATVRVDSNSDD